MAPEPRERFLGNVRVEADRIQRLVDRLLLLSSLEGRKGVQDVDEIELSTLVGDTVETMRTATAARNLNVTVDLSGPVMMRGERFLIHHALVNLLRNAIEFSPDGGKIAIACASDSRRALITVDDEGPGIPEYARQRIFERFFSLPRPDTGKKSSGLGLTFVHEVALLHGGSVTLTNLDGKGVRAELRLALSPPSVEA